MHCRKKEAPQTSGQATRTQGRKVSPSTRPSRRGSAPPVQLGAPPTWLRTMVQGLQALGHTVNVGAQSSGTSTIVRSQVGGAPSWTGGADPRREGLVLGDTFRP